MNSTKTECKATFVGFCAVPGSLSENHVFQCVRDLIEAQTNHNQQQIEKFSSTTESSKGLDNVSNREEANNETFYNDENETKTNLWIVSIEANELKWFYSNSCAQITGKRKCNRVNFSNILFCYLNAQLPNVIVWVITKKDCDDSNNGKIETEALVWKCLDEKDAIHLRDAYKLIRSRKKLEKIEAINKAKQKNSEKLIVNQKLSEKVNGNDCEQQSIRIPSVKQQIDEINKPLSAPDQQLVTSNANEILDNLLYRSCKPNPNREILVASSVHLRNSRNNKPQTRQRQPALLLQATHNNNSHSSLSSSSTTTPRQANNNVIPVVVSRKDNNYWNQYPSESEFDTTRINSYLNALNLSRRNRSNLSPGKQNGKQIRSRSVESPLNRLRMSIHKPVNSLLNAINSPSGAKMSSSNNSQTANSSNSQSRAVLVTRSESLNSEGSSISGESGICEFNSHSSHPAKSVLKKASPTTSVHIGPGKKNVTFSAYATIQVMDG